MRRFEIGSPISSACKIAWNQKNLIPNLYDEIVDILGKEDGASVGRSR
jgi:hypothetical protein